MTTHPASKSVRPLALVTGASSGIGADLARELASDGYDLVLVARRKSLLLALAEELATHGTRVTVIGANLGVFGAACRLTGELERRGLTAVDVLVNSAGFGDYAGFTRAEPTKLNEMIQLNVLTLTLLTRLLLPGMVARRRGRVLLVGGITGFAPGPGAAVYHATKAFVLSLGEALSHELRGSGVTVTTICPGPTRSGFAAAAGMPERRVASRSFGTMASAAVASHAYRALQDGRHVAVPGLFNKMWAAWLRLAPHPLVFAFAHGAVVDP